MLRVQIFGIDQDRLTQASGEGYRLPFQLQQNATAAEVRRSHRHRIAGRTLREGPDEETFNFGDVAYGRAAERFPARSALATVGSASVAGGRRPIVDATL